MSKTKNHITLVKNFLKEDIKSILEIQCGDGYDIENCEALQDKNLTYIGVDVVDEVIQDNRQYFRDEKNKMFMILDPSNEPLPKTDLVVCSGMMEYLPIANIWSLLENIRDSGAKYVAFDYYHSAVNSLKVNEDIKINSCSRGDDCNCNAESKCSDDCTCESGKPKKSTKKTAKTSVASKKKSEDVAVVVKKNKEPIFRSINLTQAPFYFPMPNFLIPTDDINKSIAVYETKNISFFMDWHNDDVSYLRYKLFSYLEEDFKKINVVFAKYDDGEKILKDILFAEKLDWGNIYTDNEKVKKIVDKNGIFTIYIDFLILLHKNGEIKRLHNDNPERYKELLTEDNFVNLTIITKDYIKWKYADNYK